MCQYFDLYNKTFLHFALQYLTKKRSGDFRQVNGYTRKLMPPGRSQDPNLAANIPTWHRQRQITLIFLKCLFIAHTFLL